MKLHIAQAKPWMILAWLAISPAAAAAAADLAVYREFRLGSTTADVIERAGAIDRDLKTLHQRPALLQELAWRPPYLLAGTASRRDSVRGVVFGFMNNRLFRIAVDYDSTRTEGMTSADMIASLVGIYGPSAPLPAPPARRAAASAFDATTPIARWRTGDTEAILQHASHANRFTLIIVTVPLDQQARKAQADAVVMDTREAPAREAAQAKAKVDAAKDAAQKTRTANKEAFKP